MSLIYDAKGELQKQPEVPKAGGDEESLDFNDLEDSQMDDQSADAQDKAGALAPKPLKKKGQSHHPALLDDFDRFADQPRLRSVGVNMKQLGHD